MVSFLVCRLVRGKNLCGFDRILLANAVAQSLGRRNPEVVALKVYSEDVVVCRGALYWNLLHRAGRVAHQHFGLMRIECGPVNGPVRTVVVGEAFVGGEPGAIAVDALNLADEVAGQTAIFGQEVMPVTAIVAARSEVGGDPEILST